MGQPLGKKVLLAYALPAMILALPTLPVYLYLPKIYGVDGGLGLAAIGAVLLLGRIFDAVSDPVVGVLSDRKSIYHRYRKPWIILGCLIAGPSLIALLNPPLEPTKGYLFWTLVLLYAGWTLIFVPYIAWGAELSDDYHERSKVTSWREGCALIGMLSASIYVTLRLELSDSRLNETMVLGELAWIACAIGAILFPLLCIKVPEKVREWKDDRSLMPQRSIHSLFPTLMRNRLFLRLFSAWFMNGIANGVPAALFLLYLEFALGADAGQRSILILLYFCSALAGIPFWRVSSQQLGKHKSWAFAMLSAVFAFSFVPFLSEGDILFFGVICVVTGLSLGADLAIPPAIQADVVDYARWRFRSEQTGLLFALWNMGTKTALACAVGFALPLVTWLGFNASENTTQNTVENASAITALVLVYAVVPGLVKLIAISIMWRFPLTEHRQAILRQRLARERSRCGHS